MKKEERSIRFIYYWGGEGRIKGISNEFEGVGFMFKHLCPSNRIRVREALEKGVIPILPTKNVNEKRLECVEGVWNAFGYKNSEEAVGHLETLNDYVLGQIVDEILETTPNPLWDALKKIALEADKDG